MQIALASPSMRPSIRFLLGLACLLAPMHLHAAPATPVRTVFLTECTPYMDWQSMGVIFSWKMSGQPGTLTRVTCCGENDRKRVTQALKDEASISFDPHADPACRSLQPHPHAHPHIITHINHSHHHPHHRTRALFTSFLSPAPTCMTARSLSAWPLANLLCRSTHG